MAEQGNPIAQSALGRSYITQGQKEQRGIYNVTFNGKKSTPIKEDMEAVDRALKYEKGFENIHTHKGFGANHIKKHIGKDKEGWVTKEELLNIGEAIRHVKPYENKGKRVYEYYNNFGDRFRIIISQNKKKKSSVITFYSNREVGTGNNSRTYNYSNSSNSEIIPQNAPKSQRKAESFQDTLKRVEGEYNEPIIKHGDGVALSYETKKRYTNPRTGQLIENELWKDANPLPKSLNEKEFKGKFGTSGWVKVDTPIGKVGFNVAKVWNHLKANTYLVDRENISGAFVKTLEDPLMIVHNPIKKQYEYYAPYRGEDGIIHLVGINKSEKGKLKNVTFFQPNNVESKILGIVNATDGNTKYFKKSLNMQMSAGEPADFRLTQAMSSKDKSNNSSLLNESISNSIQKVKPKDPKRPLDIFDEAKGNEKEVLKEKILQGKGATALYEMDDLRVKDGRVHLDVDIKNAQQTWKIAEIQRYLTIAMTKDGEIELSTPPNAP